MRRKLVGAMAVMVAVLWAASLAFADEQGAQVWGKILEAYKNTRQYRAHVKMEMVERGRFGQHVLKGDYFLVVDRDRPALLVDDARYAVRFFDGQVTETSTAAAGEYAQIRGPGTLDFEWLRKNSMLSMGKFAPDLVMLAKEAPEKMVGEAAFLPRDLKAVEPRADDVLKRPGLHVRHSEKTSSTFYYDPETFLITRVEANGVWENPSLNPPKYTVVTEIEILSRNAPLAAETFVIKTQGLRKVEKLAGWSDNDGLKGRLNAGDKAPEMRLTGLDGKAAVIKAERGRVVVLNFWATWCPACVKEMRELEEAREWSVSEKRPIDFYSVNMGESVEEMKVFCEKKGWKVPALADLDSQVCKAYGVTSLPAMVILADGKVYGSYAAEEKGTGEKLRERLKDAERGMGKGKE